jgi:hypothetical protein
MADGHWLLADIALAAPTGGGARRSLTSTGILMDERVAFITHRGHEILLIDFSGCAAKEILLLLEEVKQTVAAHERNSVLTLGDFTGAHIDRAVATRLKEVMVFDRPFVKRSALVGVESLPKVYFENIKSFTQRNFPTFKTRQEAMDYLVKD